jgi:hypothetical protein
MQTDVHTNATACFTNFCSTFHIVTMKEGIVANNMANINVFYKSIKRCEG